MMRILEFRQLLCLFLTSAGRKYGTTACLPVENPERKLTTVARDLQWTLNSAHGNQSLVKPASLSKFRMEAQAKTNRGLQMTSCSRCKMWHSRDICIVIA